MRIAMISDFFYPRLGGVENHVLNLSKELRKLGHHIIVITNANTGVAGIHYVDGFKVFYLQLITLFGGSVFPTIIGSTVPIVEILLNEKIDLVHGHQCSTLAIEGILHSRILGVPTCFTNHSLVKIESLGGVVTGSTLQLSIRGAMKIICVSGATKENTKDRLGLSEDSIVVIPNAVTEDFMILNPIKAHRLSRISDTFSRSKKFMSSFPSADSFVGNSLCKDHIVISVVTRLTARKGAGLLAEILPRLMRMDDRIRMIIVGDGDKKELLEQTVERYQLEDRVKLLGGINPSQIKYILNQSNLFLNTSLTDAFCISIIEAAACGLYVVSTDVDGIAEVLPPDMITLVKPTVVDIIAGIKSAIPKISSYNRQLSHKRVHTMYKWSIVAQKTDLIYTEIYNRYTHSNQKLLKSTGYILERMQISISRIYYLEKDRISFLFRFLLIINYILILLLVFTKIRK